MKMKMCLFKIEMNRVIFIKIQVMELMCQMIPFEFDITGPNQEDTADNILMLQMRVYLVQHQHKQGNLDRSGSI